MRKSLWAVVLSIALRHTASTHKAQHGAPVQKKGEGAAALARAVVWCWCWGCRSSARCGLVLVLGERKGGRAPHDEESAGRRGGRGARRKTRSRPACCSASSSTPILLKPYCDGLSALPKICASARAGGAALEGIVLALCALCGAAGGPRLLVGGRHEACVHVTGACARTAAARSQGPVI